MTKLLVADIGLIGFSECFALQQRLVERRINGEIEDTLLLLEHTPVITLGTSGGESNLLVESATLEREGIDLVNTNRGGNITYHGPGQLVGYPIIDLRSHGKDVHVFLRNLERVIIACLADFGLDGKGSPGYAGVFVGEDKVCSIGVAVRKWISYHGFALNVNPNFEHWSLIHPCGLVGVRVTSLERLSGKHIDMYTVKTSVTSRFAETFSVEPEKIRREELFSMLNGADRTGGKV